jgi:hypothetical protein
MFLGVYVLRVEFRLISECVGLTGMPCRESEDGSIYPFFPVACLISPLPKAPLDLAVRIQTRTNTRLNSTKFPSLARPQACEDSAFVRGHLMLPRSGNQSCVRTTLHDRRRLFQVLVRGRRDYPIVTSGPFPCSFGPSYLPRTG